MTNERIKEIQAETGYPDSVSVQQALLKVWNECDQLQQQDVSEELEEAYKEGIREGYNERHKYD